jgi:hypothetical protein
MGGVVGKAFYACVKYLVDMGISVDISGGSLMDWDGMTVEMVGISLD